MPYVGPENELVNADLVQKFLHRLKGSVEVNKGTPNSSEVSGNFA